MACTIEVVPYNEAPWAPKLPGSQFKIAWRILDTDGTHRAPGISNAPEQEVKRFAKAAAERIDSYQSGVNFLKLLPAVSLRGRKPPAGLPRPGQKPPTVLREHRRSRPCEVPTYAISY